MMGAFISSLSWFSWRWKREACGEQGTELPEPFPGGLSLAWLLPISFTSGWNRWLGLEKPLWLGEPQVCE